MGAEIARRFRSNDGDGKSARGRVVAFESLEVGALPANRAAALGAAAVHEIAFDIGRWTVAVRFVRRSAAACFAERFADMVSRESPVIRVFAVDTPDGAYFWGSAEHARHWRGSIGDELLVFFADNMALHEYFAVSGDVGLHAAVVARGGRAVALVGRSTSGKTTMALAAAAARFGLYSDERCVLQAGQVVPFLRAINVRPGTRALLLRGAPPGSIIDRLRALPSGAEAAIRPRQLVGDRAGGPPLPLAAAFVIAGRGETPAIEQSSLHAALPALLRSVAVREAGIERAARVLAALRGIPIFRLRLGSPESSVAVIERVLGACISGA